MELVLVYGGSLVFAGGIVWLAVYSARHQFRKIETLFERIAHRMNGRFLPGARGLFRWDSPAVEVDLDGACALLDTEIVRHGKSSTLYTRVRAEYVMPSGPSFRVSKQKIFHSLGKAFGLEDLVLGGDVAFDERFVVKADDPDGVSTAWTPDAKTLMLGLDDVVAQADGHLVEVRWHGYPKDPDRLEGAIRLVSTLARHGLWLLEDLDQMVPDARYRAPEGPWSSRSHPSIEISTDAGMATAAPVTYGGWTVMRMTLPCARELPTFKTKLSGSLPSDLPAGVVDADAAPTAAQVGLADLAFDGALLRLYFRGGFGPDFHERLGAGASLLAAIATSKARQGVFR